MCSDGTEAREEDGKCVSVIKKCGKDTHFVPGNKAGGGKCRPRGTVCESGTMFDEAKKKCFPSQSVCATGTELKDGRCVLNASACGTGTVLRDGLCVATPSRPSDLTSTVSVNF